MDDGLAHIGKDGLGTGKGPGAAADHERQRTAIGCCDTARNRGIDCDQAPGFGACRNIAGGRNIDGRTVDQ